MKTLNPIYLAPLIKTTRGSYEVGEMYVRDMSEVNWKGCKEDHSLHGKINNQVNVLGLGTPLRDEAGEPFIVWGV